MARLLGAYGSLAQKLPVPRRMRVIWFNALQAKKPSFLQPRISCSTPSRKPQCHRALPSSVPIKRNDEKPDFEVVSKAKKVSPLAETEVVETIHLKNIDASVSFNDLGVAEGLEASLASLGVRQPTPVQVASIPAILDEKDVAVQCYTGSGKTLAFLIPVIMMALDRAQKELDSGIPDSEIGQLQALIVSPSRELAMQTVRVAKSLLPEEARPAIQQCIGGANYTRQADALRQKPIIIIGTPGRIADHSRTGVILTHNCPVLVLDEVDQLMARHFAEDMARITDHCGKKLLHRETILVSATLTKNAVKRVGQWAPRSGFTFITSSDDTVASQYQPAKESGKPTWGWDQTPRTISSTGGVGTSTSRLSLPPTLKHGYIVAPAARKVDMLRRCIHGMNANKALVFMNFQKRLQDTVHKLAAKNMEVGSVHGEKSKLDRERILRKFREGAYRALIVSDVLARGLDVEDCDSVFNLEMPSDSSHYAHRAGRTGRMGKDGWVVSIVTINEVFVVEKMAQQLGIRIDELVARGGEVNVKHDLDRSIS